MPLTEARQAARQIEHHRAEMARWAAIRAAAIQTALNAGMRQADIARALGVTPAAIGKLTRAAAGGLSVSPLPLTGPV